MNSLTSPISKSWIDRHPLEGAAAAIAVWSLSAFLFVARSPQGAFSHDFKGHVEFTHILYSERRLPAAREGWETYQPPLYYLINTLASPERSSHTFQVRILSVFYGAVTLLLMSRLLTRFGIPPSTQLIVLAFIATLPAFFFLFTTYNNDSLATLLSVALLSSAHAWIMEARRRHLILFAALAIAALYTKLSSVFPLASLSVMLALLGWKRCISWRRIRPIWAAIVLGFFLLSPWLLLHNYRQTGYLTPTPADFPVDSHVRLPHSALRTLLTPPGWSSNEWADPYAHLWESTHHKKNSFLAYLFSTSIFSEFRFESLPPILPWSIAILHAILWIVALANAWKTKTGQLALGFFMLGVACLPTLIFRSAYASLMDFRYIAWVWLPLALIYATSLAAPERRPYPSLRIEILRAFMWSGIFFQGVFWVALIVGGRWNFP